jgi:hypothetical protein
MVKPNAETRLGKSYSFSVGRTGLIFVELDADPFVGSSANTIWQLGAQLAQRAHINKEQKGFVIDARNIQLTNLQSQDEIPDEEDPDEDEIPITNNAIHIKAVRDDKSVEEVVWPARVQNAQVVFDLATDLRKRATS